jgi:hypothetical protein
MRLSGDLEEALFPFSVTGRLSCPSQENHKKVKVQGARPDAPDELAQD